MPVRELQTYWKRGRIHRGRHKYAKVVQAFAEAIGFAVFPAVLDVAPPVADGAGGGVDGKGGRVGLL